MTIKEAIGKRIPRIRLPIWGNPNAYLRLPLFKDGHHGPWAEVYDDFTQQEVLKVLPGSDKICVFAENIYSSSDDFEPYTGPVSPFETHSENYASRYEEK